MKSRRGPHHPSRAGRRSEPPWPTSGTRRKRAESIAVGVALRDLLTVAPHGNVSSNDRSRISGRWALRDLVLTARRLSEKHAAVLAVGIGHGHVGPGSALPSFRSAANARAGPRLADVGRSSQAATDAALKLGGNAGSLQPDCGASEEPTAPRPDVRHNCETGVASDSVGLGGLADGRPTGDGGRPAHHRSSVVRGSMSPR